MQQRRGGGFWGGWGLLCALFLLWGGLSPQSARAQDRLSALEARIAQLEAQLAQRPKDPGAYALPATLTFCGQRIATEDPWIRERVERELLLVLGDRAQVALWRRRAARVFPVVEAEAKALGTCDDLKYVAVIESGLRPAVTSHASARGWWQFMAPTAQEYGLTTDLHWDMRADLEASTRAGLRYLQDLHQSFESWPLAMAAYNTGPGRLRRAQSSQGQRDYWRLDLHPEAARYVPRVLAIKAVMSDPAAYDLPNSMRGGAQLPPVGLIKVNVPKGYEIALVEAAKATGIPLNHLKRLNPQLGAPHFPTAQTITLRVPQGQAHALRDWLHAEVSRQKPRVAAKKASAARSAKRAPPARKGVAKRPAKPRAQKRSKR